MMATRMQSTALAFVLLLSSLLVNAHAPVNRTSWLRASAVLEEAPQNHDFKNEDEDYDEEWMDDLDEWQQDERELNWGVGVGGGGGGGGQSNPCNCPLPLFRLGKRVPEYCRLIDYVCPGDLCPGGREPIDCDDGGIGIPPVGMMMMRPMMAMRPMRPMQGPRPPVPSPRPPPASLPSSKGSSKGGSSEGGSKGGSKGSKRRDLEYDEEEYDEEYVVEQRKLKGSKVSS